MKNMGGGGGVPGAQRPCRSPLQKAAATLWRRQDGEVNSPLQNVALTRKGRVDLSVHPPLCYFVFGLSLLAGAGAASRCGHYTGSGLRSDVYLDLLGLGFLALGEAERQHAIVIVGLYGVRLYGVGQREAAAERAIGALDAQIVVLVRLGVELAFAANGEDVVLHTDVQVLRIHIRQVGLNDQFMLGFVDVDGRGPRGQVRLLGGMS